MDASSQLARIAKFQAYLGIDGAAMARLGHRLRKRPMPLSELADIGHASPLGRQFADRFSDVATPPGFVGVRELLGARILVDAAADHALVHSLQRQGRADWMLKEYPAIRHIRHGLASDLLAAEPVQPWPGMRAPLKALQLFVPKGIARIESESEEDWAVSIQARLEDRLGRLTIEWGCWGANGSTGHSNGPEVVPTSSGVSRLIWGAVALLAGEPEEVVVANPGSRTGFIRSKRERPSPSWIEPRRRYVHEGSNHAPKGEGPSPAPHWRAGHPHRYRVGPGRKEERIHWIPAIWCSDAAEED